MELKENTVIADTLGPGVSLIEGAFSIAGVQLVP